MKLVYLPLVYSASGVQGRGSGPHMMRLDKGGERKVAVKRRQSPADLFALCYASLTQAPRRVFDLILKMLGPTPALSAGRLAASGQKRTSATAADWGAL